MDDLISCHHIHVLLRYTTVAIQVTLFTNLHLAVGVLCGIECDLLVCLLAMARSINCWVASVGEGATGGLCLEWSGSKIN